MADASNFKEILNAFRLNLTPLDSDKFYQAIDKLTGEKLVIKPCNDNIFTAFLTPTRKIRDYDYNDIIIVDCLGNKW